MSDDIIQVPRFVDGKVFYANTASKALADVKGANYEALFMNELLGIRAISNKDGLIWSQWYCSPSVRVTGTTKQGNKVVAYAHVPNYFSNPNNIATAVKKGLKNGAGIYPEKHFQHLLDLEDGENVFVIDYKTLRTSSSGVIPVAEAMKHPQVVPFIGGIEEAENYLKRHEKVVGKNIGVYHSDDLSDVPYGRVLFVYFRSGSGLIVGFDDLHCGGRFVGVPLTSEAGAQKILSPLEKLVGKGTDVGNGLVVVKSEDITPSQYRLLTRKE